MARKRGEPGEPGQPGQPPPPDGTSTGGAGGAGGEGGAQGERGPVGPPGPPDGGVDAREEIAAAAHEAKGVVKKEAKKEAKAAQRRRRLANSVLPLLAVLALVCVVVAGAAGTATIVSREDIDKNAATLEDLCSVAKNARRALEAQFENSTNYLASPAGRESNGLNDFIRQVSIPQLRQRLKVEQIPPSCVP